MSKPNPKYGASIHARTFCAMLRMLHDGDSTKSDIMSELGLAAGTVTKWMKLLGADRPKAPGRLVHVVDWRRRGDRGNWAAVWAYGYEVSDKPKPKPMTPEEYHQRYKSKIRRRRMLGQFKPVSRTQIRDSLEEVRREL